MERYLAVRTGDIGAGDTRFYVVAVDSGLAVTTHGSWADAQATARLGNEDPTDHREAYCRQCETTLSVDALTAECGVCGSRYIGTMGGRAVSTHNDIDPIDPETLDTMRSRARAGDTWHAYRNEDLGHYDLGRLTFLVTGPTRTFQAPPKQAPDSADIGLGWRYQYVGTVDLEAGIVVPSSREAV